MVKIIKYSLIYSTMAIAFLWIGYLSLTPIIFRDELILHMAFPKIWAAKGFFFYQDFNLSSVGMMNLDYIYMLLIKYFHSEQLPKILHASLLVLSAASIFIFLKKRFGLFISYALSMIFMLIPINQRLASEAYVDLGVLFFSTISLIFLVKWLESGLDEPKWFILASVFSGLCAGTKYSGAVFTIAIGLNMVLSYSRQKGSNKGAFRIGLIYSAIVLLTISPWLVRNYFAVGNPFYPLLNSVFKPDIIQIDNILYVPPSEYVTRMILGESFWDIITIPFRMFISGKDGDFIGGFDGKFNPFIFFSLFIIVFKSVRQRMKDRKIAKSLIFVFILSFIIFLIYGHLRLRYFIYILPVIILLNGYILNSIFPDFEQKKRRYSLFLFIFFFFTAAYNIFYSVDYFQRIDTFDYIFGKETKSQYLTRRSFDYRVARQIEKETEEESCIYLIMNGHRSYYINRNYAHDNYILDRMMFKMFHNGSNIKNYLDFFSSLPYSNMKKADYILIDLAGFYETAQNIFLDLSAEEMNTNIELFEMFLKSQTFIFKIEGTYLFRINYGEL